LIPQFDGATLLQGEGGVPVAELCREHSMSTAFFYKWCTKYGGMDASMISQMKSLEDEKRRLKRMFADLSIQADLKSLEKSDGAISASRDGRHGSGASRGKHRVRPLSSNQWRKWAHTTGRP
jgi:putative transposase